MVIRMTKNNRFYNYYDGVESYLIEDINKEVVFQVWDRSEADDITAFLNKQNDIIESLQNEDPINTVEIIEMKRELDRMINFHAKRKSERVINNIKYDVLVKLRDRWFND